MRKFMRWLSLIGQFIALLTLLFIAQPGNVFIASGGKPKQSNADGTVQDTRKVLIGYIRQSYSVDEDDDNSAKRQLANLQDIANRLGLVLEVYQDVGGHKSGRDTEKRDGWKEAEQRLLDPDVKGLAVNDLSRAHRKGWRAGQLIELLEKRQQILVLARYDRVLDLSIFQDRLIASFVTFIDQYYADDIAERMLDSIRRRRNDGKTIARPPAGTIRDNNGFLMLSPRGAWLLSDGNGIAGEQDNPPAADAIWRGYADCVLLVLELFSHNDIGTGGITRKLNENGWFVRDNNGRPRFPKRDDVRRIIAAWPQYAGLVVIGRSKDRRRSDIPLDWIDTGRSVFPLDLLRRIASVEHERRQTRGVGSVQHSHPYLGRGLLYCEHCEQRVDQTGNVQYRNHLTGTNQNGRPRLRHAEGIPCTCTVRSVLAKYVDPQILALLQPVHMREGIHTLLEGEGSALANFEQVRYEELEALRRGTIAYNKRRLLAAQSRYDDGEITKEQYDNRRTVLVKIISELEPQVTSREVVRMDFARFLKIAANPTAAYELATPVDRQLLMTLMFEGIWYNLDTRQITRVRWQPWVTQFLTV